MGMIGLLSLLGESGLEKYPSAGLVGFAVRSSEAEGVLALDSGKKGIPLNTAGLSPDEPSAGLGASGLVL